jgi:hypothetical protein
MDQIIEEHPNTYDSSSNGEIEIAEKTITGLLRTNKIDLEKRIGKAIPQAHPLFSWLVEHCSWIHNVRTRGNDGLTAYQRARLKDFKKMLIAFGELVLVHMPIKGPERREGGALEPRAVEGIFLGYGKESHSYVVYINGVTKQYRSVCRMPLSKRWSADKLEAMHVSRRDAHDGRGARAVPLLPRDQDQPGEEPAKGRLARKLELRQGDFDPEMGGFGWTEHCSKCTKARAYGWKASINMQHSAPCRVRIEAELAQTEKGKMRIEHVKERLDRCAARIGEPEVVPGPADAADARPEGEMAVPQFEELPQGAPVGGGVWVEDLGRQEPTTSRTSRCTTTRTS